jgi:hypothetical protein
VFAEKVTGAVSDRKALAKAIAALGVGDVLLVSARFGRAVFEVACKRHRIGSRQTLQRKLMSASGGKAAVTRTSSDAAV